MYIHSSNNSTTSLSDNDEDEVKDFALCPYTLHPSELAPAHWAASRGYSLKQPTHSPASQLPPEILIHILRQLHSSRDLHSSLLVCRSWCECAVELLWHRPSFNDLTRFVQMLQVICAEEKTFDYAQFVRRLNFMYISRDLTDSLFVRLARCVKLERLTLVNCNEISDEALMRVLPMCTNLVALDLTNIVACSDRSIIALARSATKLQGLNLGGCRNVTDEGVGAVATYCPTLRRIKLSNCKNITDKSVIALAKKCPLLLEIDLQGCTKVTDIAVQEIWLHLRQLRDFRLAQCGDLTDLAFPSSPHASVDTCQGVLPFLSHFPALMDGLPPLKLSRLCEHLRMLDLTACSLTTDEAVAGIIACAPKIRNLYLAKCLQLTDAAVESICKLGKHLHYLHLGHASAITDRSVRTLARSCTRLRYIDLACCSLLTDLSVFELSGLSRLRRIGLVRVANLTDQAVYSLADRHQTLERIHLSYCENISVLAIHFLLQRVTKLTHLSLTGIPAFRRPELQQFCRPAPREFNTTQRAAFCVYSGKGVDDLRTFLADLMARVQATDDTVDYETDYDAEEDEEEEILAMAEQERGLETTETPRVAYSDDGNWRTLIDGPVFAQEEVFDGNAMARNIPMPSTVSMVRGRAIRVVAERSITPARRPPLVEDTNISSLSTTPSPNITPESGNVGRFAQNPIIETPSPSPAIQPYEGQINLQCSSRLYSSPNLSDGTSNRSELSSKTNNTSASNGAGFFHSYSVAGPSSPEVMSAVNNEVRTPDLVYAEIGHGRGRSTVITSGSSIDQHLTTQSGSSVPLPYEGFLQSKARFTSFNFSETALGGGLGGRPVTIARPSGEQFRNSPAQGTEAVPLSYRENVSSSPIPYLSSSPTTRELQESVHSALSDTPLIPGIISEDAMADSRGRGMQRSLKSTLTAAEHYASALFFSRNGSSSSHPAVRAVTTNGTGIPHTEFSNAQNQPDRH